MNTLVTNPKDQAFFGAVLFTWYYIIIYIPLKCHIPSNTTSLVTFTDDIGINVSRINIKLATDNI